MRLASCSRFGASMSNLSRSLSETRMGRIELMARERLRCAPGLEPHFLNERKVALFNECLRDSPLGGSGPAARSVQYLDALRFQQPPSLPNATRPLSVMPK